MKSFWSRYKAGLLIFVLPIVVLFLAYKAALLFLGFADALGSWFPESKILRVVFVVGCAVWAPFILGSIFSSKWFRKILEKILAKMPARMRWLVRAVFKMNVMDNNEVVLFRAYNNDEDPSYKIGVVMQTFNRIGPHDFKEAHCLILEGTPPLPSGPHWVKKRSRLIFINPDFGVKDFLITIFSMGFNFPIDEKQKPSV